MARRFKEVDQWEFAQAIVYDYEQLRNNNPGNTALVQFMFNRLKGHQRSLRYNDYGHEPLSGRRYQRQWKKAGEVA